MNCRVRIPPSPPLQIAAKKRVVESNFLTVPNHLGSTPFSVSGRRDFLVFWPRGFLVHPLRQFSAQASLFGRECDTCAAQAGRKTAFAKRKSAPPGPQRSSSQSFRFF